MANPLTNKGTDIEDVRFFPDADNAKLFYYGLAPKWSDLSVNKIGERYEIIHGEIDFEPDAELLKRAEAQLGADQLLPVPIDFIKNDLRLAIHLGNNHNDDSSIVNTLPFPRFMLRVTISLAETNAGAISSQIQEKWGGYEGLLEGDVEASVSGSSLILSFECNNPYQEIFDQIVADSMNLSQPRRVLETNIYTAFEDNFGTWVSTDSSGTTNELILKSFLSEFFFKAYSIEDGPLVRFDDGSVLTGLILREPREVGSHFVVSGRKTVSAVMAISAFGSRDLFGPQSFIDFGNMAEELAANEFDPSGGLDDTSAFEETSCNSNVEVNPDFRSWRPAHSLKKLKDQVDKLFPARSKKSDGFIGDENHCPGSSDHCPNVIVDGVGVVAAFDCTHDPLNGCDMHVITRQMAISRDKRIKYIIYNSEICSSYPIDGFEEWQWRPYSGGNPHERHAHFSVVSDKELFDDMSNWKITRQGQDSAMF